MTYTAQEWRVIHSGGKVYVDLCPVKLLRAGYHAIRVRTDEYEGLKLWIPYSVIKAWNRDSRQGSEVEIEVEKWFAAKHDLPY